MENNKKNNEQNKNNVEIIFDDKETIEEASENQKKVRNIRSSKQSVSSSSESTKRKSSTKKSSSRRQSSNLDKTQSKKPGTSQNSIRKTGNTKTETTRTKRKNTNFRTENTKPKVQNDSISDEDIPLFENTSTVMNFKSGEDAVDFQSKKDKKNKKNKMPKKKKIIIALSIILGIILLLGIVFGVYLFKAGGNVKEAVLNIATDIVGDQDPIFVLILGVSEDISAKLTDTIILCGYNPSTQKAFMLSVPRDTFVGTSESSANGYDKINAQFQTSAEKTVESVELLTGVTIDYYVIVRNISITSIFECFGSIDFDVPIDMDYDDPTQDLHIHLKKGYQTLEPDQIEQLLRFRHNNDGTSYPSSYGDNDYGRMRTQREFIKAAMEQILSIQNVGKLKDLAAMMYTNVQTNMSGTTLLDYVPYGLQFSTSNLRSEQLPGSSALINELWFYRASKSETKTLMDELMIYLELDDETLDSHYKYASEIKGVKPDDNWVSNEVIIDDDYETTSSKKSSNTTTNEVVDQSTCEHQYVVYEDTDQAGCEKTGTVVYKCTICGKEYQKQTEALGHNYKNGYCTRCNKKDPSYTSTSTNKNTTSSNTTSNTTSSNNDSSTKNQTSDNTVTHTHSYTETVSTTDPTCTKAGTVTKKCSCGDTQTTDTLPATGHIFSDWVPTKEATTDAEGEQQRTCSSCNTTETKTIPKLTTDNSSQTEEEKSDSSETLESSSK